MGWIEEREGGTWAVDGNHPNLWRIVNIKTGRTKVIGPASRPGESRRTNNFDRAIEECKRRNDKEAVK